MVRWLCSKVILTAYQQDLCFNNLVIYFLANQRMDECVGRAVRLGVQLGGKGRNEGAKSIYHKRHKDLRSLLSIQYHANIGLSRSVSHDDVKMDCHVRRVLSCLFNYSFARNLRSAKFCVIKRMICCEYFTTLF